MDAWVGSPTVGDIFLFRYLLKFVINLKLVSVENVLHLPTSRKLFYRENITSVDESKTYEKYTC